MAEVSLPGGFGGLVRYKEEYDSPFKIKPETVVLLIILSIGFVLALRLIFPMS